MHASAALLVLTGLLRSLRLCKSLKPIYIGGFVNNFDSDGNVTVAGVEALAAANLAIGELNNKTDGIFDHILPNHYFSTSYANANDYVAAVQNAYYMDYGAFSKRGVDVALIAGIIPLETEAIMRFLAKKKIVAVSTNDQSPELSVGANFPFKIRLAPSESYTGTVLQDIAHAHMGIRHVGVFHTLDTISSHAAREFLSGGNFDLLFQKELNEESQDFSHEIESVKHSGARVFVLFADVITSSYLLTQGFKKGLFGKDTLILAHDTIVSNSSLRAFMLQIDSDLDVDSALKSIIGVRYHPQFKIESTPEGQAFMTRWREQDATVKYDGSGRANCSYDRDSDGSFLLYRSSMSAPSSKCAGLDFSVYHMNATNIGTFTPISYDSVIALAHGLHHILHTRNLSSWNGDDLMTALLNVSFVGATGAIAFEKGEGSLDSIYNDRYGMGDRKVGHAFELVSYQKATGKFEAVGLWDEEGDYQLCDEHLYSSLESVTVVGTELLVPCEHYVVYNTADGKRPADRLPDIIIDTHIEVIASMSVLGSIAIAAVMIVSVVLIIHREKKLTKASQPPLMAVILFGTVLAFARTITGGLPNTTTKCISNLWLGHLAFVMVFGALALKAWRVDKIVNSTSLRRVKISNTDVARILLYLIACAVVYLIVTTIVGSPTLHSTEEVKSNRKTVNLVCGMEHAEFEDVLFGLEGLLLLWGARLCNATKSAPSAINESAPVANTMIIILSVAIPVMCIIFLLYQSIGAVGVEVLGSIAFLIGGLATIILIFVPKVIVLLSGQDVNLKISHASKEEEAEKQVYATGDGPSGEEEEQLLVQTAKRLLKGKDLDARFVICQRQLNYWRAEVMMIEERRTSDGSTNASSSKASSSIVLASDDAYAITVKHEGAIQ